MQSAACFQTPCSPGFAWAGRPRSALSGQMSHTDVGAALSSALGSHKRPSALWAPSRGKECPQNSFKSGEGCPQQHRESWQTAQDGQQHEERDGTRRNAEVPLREPARASRCSWAGHTFCQPSTELRQHEPVSRGFPQPLTSGPGGKHVAGHRAAPSPYRRARAPHLRRWQEPQRRGEEGPALRGSAEEPGRAEGSGGVKGGYLSAQRAAWSPGGARPRHSCGRRTWRGRGPARSPRQGLPWRRSCAPRPRRKHPLPPLGAASWRHRAHLPPADYRSQQVARGAPRLNPGSGGRAGPSGRCSPRGKRGSSRTRRVAWWEA